MVGNRRIRGQVIDPEEIEPDDDNYSGDPLEEIDEPLVILCPDDGPALSGGDNETVICGRCERTLLLGISPKHASAAIRRAFGLAIPNVGTAVEGRPDPAYVQCDCDAMNRVWPLNPI